MSLLVSISGVDLAGKTTQLDLLERWLEEGGTRTARLWYRPGYSDTLNRLRSAVRSLRPGALPASGPSEARARAFARPGVSIAWMTMATLDSVSHYGVRVRASLARYRVVLSDRWIEDAVLDFELRFPEAPVARIRALFEAVAPRPDLRVMLVLPWAEVLRRLDDKVEPFPDPIEQRRRRFDAYCRLADTGRYLVVDATRSVENIQDELRARVRALLGGE